LASQKAGPHRHAVIAAKRRVPRQIAGNGIVRPGRCLQQARDPAVEQSPAGVGDSAVNGLPQQVVDEVTVLGAGPEDPAALKFL
jgi:hypothetical protein